MARGLFFEVSPYMAEFLSFLHPRDPSFGLHPSFNFAVINRNLLKDFNERESIESPKDEQMPVFLRIRPLNPGEPSTKVVCPRGSNSVIIAPPVDEKSFRSAMFNFNQTTHEFSFTRVFDETTKQAEFFEDVILDRVTEFLEGINGLIFAYGTTSSGKTFTLQGKLLVYSLFGRLSK